MPPKWCNTTEEQASLRSDAHNASVRSVVTGLWPVSWCVVPDLLARTEMPLTCIHAVACCQWGRAPHQWALHLLLSGVMLLNGCNVPYRV